MSTVTPPVDPVVVPPPTVAPAAPITAPPAPDADDLANVSQVDLAKMVKDLRKESATNRTKAKDAADKLKSVRDSLGLGDNESPEEKAKKLAAEKETVTFENAVLVNALEHGIPKEGLDYFSFLVNRAVGGLQAGEELSVEKITELAKEAKAKAMKVPATTTPVAPGTPPAPAGGAAPITVEQFAGMSMHEKSRIFTTTPDLYESLMRTAIEKKLIK